MIQQSILHDYPFPIAKCYERVIGARDPFERWEKNRYLFEVFLKYSACLAIAEYLKTHQSDSQINASLKYLARPSLGHWFNLFSSIIKYLRAKNDPIASQEIFERIKDRPGLIKGWNSLREFIEPGKSSNSESTTIIQFMEAMVTYRNRTAGHGAPQVSHLEAFLPVIETALVDLLLAAKFLTESPLLYLAEIRVERTSFIHVLFRLMGTTKALLRDYVTDREHSLIGLDKQLFIGLNKSDVPLISLHPLVIHTHEEIFLLQNSDLKHNVEYICHNSGATYSADRIYEDLKNTLGSFILGENEVVDRIDGESIFRQTIRMALFDGVISDEERENLKAIAERLDIPEMRLREIESEVIHDSKAEKSESEIPPLASGAPLRKKERADTVRNTRLLFFPYASVRLGFWADLVSRLAASAHKQGFAFSMVAPNPDADYDAASMTALLADIDEILQAYEPEIIILAPSPSAAFLSLFERCFPKIRIPMLTVDTVFYNYDYFSKNSIQPPPIIQVDNERGGELAAERLLQRAGAEDGKKVNFLVLPGLEDAPHSRLRVKGFEKRIKEAFPEARIRILSAGGFQRKKAKEVFSGFLEDADIGRYKGVFCCNDEMALGVYSCLLAEAKIDPDTRFEIVGFNNTTEMQSAVENDRTGFLAGSVDQNLVAYVERILDIAAKLIKGAPVDSKYLIPPIFVPGGLIKP